MSRPPSRPRRIDWRERRTPLRPGLEALEGRDLLATFTVTDVGDAGPGTLRQAILDANASPGTDRIAFDIPGAGVRTIRPASSLPGITDPLIVDGYTEPGARPNTRADGEDAVLLIELEGSAAGGGADGLTIIAGDSTVRGLVINRFPGSALVVQGGGGNRIQGNFLGTDATGTLPRGNALVGIAIVDSADNLVGGTGPADRNLVGDNNTGGISILNPASTGNRIQGNFLGTDATGRHALGNNGPGVLVAVGASGNTIGGTAPGARNVLGDNGIGIAVSNRGTAANRIQGNFIGTDVTGTQPLAQTTGVLISDGAFGNLLGGTTPGARNVISGNIVGVFLKEVSAGEFRSDGVVTAQNVVQGNFIGTDATGLERLGNDLIGVLLANVSDSRIGGSEAGSGNVISGSTGAGVQIFGPLATGNVVQGNFIGTDAGGGVTAESLRSQALGVFGPLGNLGGGVFINAAPGNTIGGMTPGARNVISGNGTAGVQIFGPLATGNVVLGNLIGTDAAGVLPLGNAPDGVLINDAPGNTVGGAGLAGNVISGNAAFGVHLFGPLAAGNVVRGNFIGTDATGTRVVASLGDLPLGNVLDGVFLNNAPRNLIGGSTPGAANVIAGNRRNGVHVLNALAAGNLVQGNHIGTDVTGTAGLGNRRDGIAIEEAGLNLIGGALPGQGNLLADNGGAGVGVRGSNARDNAVIGNTIGTDRAGVVALGNHFGVVIDSASGTLVVGDLISGNRVVGVQISGFGASGNAIRGSTIGTDRASATAVSNGVGVFLNGVAGNSVGGDGPGEGNLISGNATAGVHVFGRLASANAVRGNLIGTDGAGRRPIAGPGGQLAQGVGVLINQAPGLDPANQPLAGNSVGGTTPGARNVIAGNTAGVVIAGGDARGNVVLGNFIGTTAAGGPGAGNVVGVFINDAPGNVIGGAAGNVISGNVQVGVSIQGRLAVGNRVEGNRIGVDPEGRAAVPNRTGVFVQGASGNAIGGATPGAGNLIAGNAETGIYLFDQAAGNGIRGNTIGGRGGLRNGQYGVLLFNAPNNGTRSQVIRGNRISGSGIANFREFTGRATRRLRRGGGAARSTSPSATP